MRGRAVLATWLVMFAALQVGLGQAIDRWAPELRDAEYGRKLALLRAAQAAHGDRPLLLVLGTSRTAFGFRPAASVEEATRGPAWQFNFGITGTGPLQELMYLRRLLDAGIRPRRLLIEIHPPLLHQTPDWCETKNVDVRRLDWRDVRVLARCAFEPCKLWVKWLPTSLAPWHTHRVAILRRFAPRWPDAESRSRDETFLRDTAADGWARFPFRASDEEERRRVTTKTVGLYAPMLDDFQVTEGPRRALAETLGLCRRERIETALFLMPEGSLFRERYPLEARTRLDGYLAELRREYGVALFDASAWCADRQFFDGQHLLPEGADSFTARFEHDAVEPWLSHDSIPAGRENRAERLAERKPSHSGAQSNR